MTNLYADLNGGLVMEMDKLSRMLHTISLHLVNEIYTKHFGDQKARRFWENRIACLTNSLSDPQSIGYARQYVSGVIQNILLVNGVDITEQDGMNERFLQQFPSVDSAAGDKTAWYAHIYKIGRECGQESLFISGDVSALCNSVIFQHDRALYSDKEITLAKIISSTRNQRSHDAYSPADFVKDIHALTRLIEYINKEMEFSPYFTYSKDLIDIKNRCLFFSEIGKSVDVRETAESFGKQTKQYAPYLSNAFDLIAVVTMQEEQYETVVKSGCVTYPSYCYVSVATLLGFLLSEQESCPQSDYSQALENLIAVFRNILNGVPEEIPAYLQTLKQCNEFLYTVFTTHMLIYCEQIDCICIRFRSHASRYVWLMNSRYLSYIDSVRAQKIYMLMKSSYFVHKEGTQAPSPLSYSSESTIGRGINATISRYLNAIAFLRYLPDPLTELYFLLDHGNHHHAYLCLMAEVDQNDNPLVRFFDNQTMADEESNRRDQIERLGFYQRLVDEHYSEVSFWRSVAKHFSHAPHLLLQLLKSRDFFTGKERFCLSPSLWKALYHLDNWKIEQRMNAIMRDYFRQVSDWSTEKTLDEKLEIVRFFTSVNSNAWLLMQGDRVEPALKDLLIHIFYDREIGPPEKAILIRGIRGNDAAYLSLSSDEIFCNAIQKTLRLLPNSLPEPVKVIPADPSSVEVLQNTLAFLNTIPREADGLEELCEFWGIQATNSPDEEWIRSGLLLAVSKRFLELYRGDVLAQSGFELLYQYILGLHYKGDLTEAEALLKMFSEENFHTCDVLVALAKDLYELFLQKAVEDKLLPSLTRVLLILRENESTCFWDAVVNLLDFIRTEKNYINKASAYHAVLGAFDSTADDILHFSQLPNIEKLTADVFQKIFPSDAKQRDFVRQTIPCIGYASSLLKLEAFLTLQEAQKLPLIHFAKRQKELAKPFQQLRSALFSATYWMQQVPFKVKVALLLSCSDYEDLRQCPEAQETLHQEILKPLSQACLTTAQVRERYGYYTEETFYYHVLTLTRNNPEWTVDICKGIQCKWRYFSLQYKKSDDKNIFFTALQNPHLRTLAYIVTNKMQTMLQALEHLEKPIIRISHMVTSEQEFFEMTACDTEVLSYIKDVSENYVLPDQLGIMRWLNSNIFYALRSYLHEAHFADIPSYFENRKRENLRNSNWYPQVQALATLDNCVDGQIVDLHWFEFLHHALPNQNAHEIQTVRVSEVNHEYLKNILSQTYEYASMKGGVKPTTLRTREATIFLVEKRTRDFLLLDGIKTFTTILQAQAPDCQVLVESFRLDNAVALENHPYDPSGGKKKGDSVTDAIANSIQGTMREIQNKMYTLKLCRLNGKLYERDLALALHEWSQDTIQALTAYHLIRYVCGMPWAKQKAYANDERKRRVERALEILSELKEPTHLAILTELSGTAFTARLESTSFYGTIVQTDLQSSPLGKHLGVTYGGENFCTLHGTEPTILQDDSVLCALIKKMDPVSCVCSLMDIPGNLQFKMSLIEYPVLRGLKAGAVISVRVQFQCEGDCQKVAIRPFEYERLIPQPQSTPDVCADDDLMPVVVVKVKDKFVQFFDGRKSWDLLPADVPKEHYLGMRALVKRRDFEQRKISSFKAAEGVLLLHQKVTGTISGPMPRDPKIYFANFHVEAGGWTIPFSGTVNLGREGVQNGIKLNLQISRLFWNNLQLSPTQREPDGAELPTTPATAVLPTPASAEPIPGAPNAPVQEESVQQPMLAEEPIVPCAPAVMKTETALHVREVHGNTAGNIANNGHLAVAGEWVYYAYDGLYKISLDGTSRFKLCDDKCAYLNVLGNWVYYQNMSDACRLYRIRTDGCRRSKLNNDGSWYINVVDDQVYYSNSDQRFVLYTIGTNGTHRRRLNNDSSFSVIVADGWIYFRNRDDQNRPYRMRLNGSDKSVIGSDAAFTLNVQADWIYYKNGNDANSLYKMRLDGSARTKLTSSRCKHLNVIDSVVYYRNETQGDALYRVSVDGGVEECMGHQSCAFIHELGEAIYYMNGCDKCSVRKDGSELKLLSDIW